MLLNGLCDSEKERTQFKLVTTKKTLRQIYVAITKDFHKHGKQGKATTLVYSTIGTGKYVLQSEGILAERCKQ